MSASYGDQAAALMAEIADALFNGKENWQILEQLQQALLAKTGLERLREVNDTLYPDTAAAIKSIYEPAILKQLYEEKSMRKMLDAGPKTFNYNFASKPDTGTTTTNSAEWIKYSMKDYGARYDLKGDDA